MTRPLPPLNALRAFEAAARHASFTRAAGELHVTQGAVSRHVKNLEDRLGVQLFVRGPQGLVLTPAGSAYLPAVSEAFDRLATATAALRGPGASRVLTVSVSPNFASKWLVHRLGDFAREHPDIDLRIAAGTEEVDFARAPDVDVGVRHGEGGWSGVDAVRLIGEEVYPVLSPALLAKGPPLDTPEDLRHYTLLRDLSSNGWPAWLAMVGARGVDGEKGPYFNFTSMALDAAVAGQGVALARRALATHDLLTGRLVRPFPQTLTSPRGYYVVCLPGRAGESKIVRFRAWLLSEALRDRQRLASLPAGTHGA